MSRRNISLSMILLALVLAVYGFLASGQARGSASASPITKNDATAQMPLLHPTITTAVHFDISPPLRSIPPVKVQQSFLSNLRDAGPIPAGPFGRVVDDPVVQKLLSPPAIPTPLISFNGPPNLCGGCAPPDPNGEVGPNHIVVMSNLSFQIFNKTGTSLFGPAANNTLWSGFGGGCQTRNDGDPVVLYDQLADRWLLSQFTSAAPFLNCVALSQTNDPTGAYYRWAFPVGSGVNFGDYPKYGMWPNAYYISTREFQGGTGGPFAGVGAYAANRTQMLAGNPNPTVLSFLAPPSPAYVVGDGLLPADLDGTTLPPTDNPEYFVGSEDDNGGYGAPADALTLWKFVADFSVPANSTFTLANTIPSAPFNSVLALCGGGRACIPQFGTTNKIDHQGYRQRPIFRLAYRNMGTYQSLVTNQSVSAGTGPSGEVSGIRWWEIRSPASSPVIYQQGTYAPGLTDGIHRWMGSIAMNGRGNIALGYSASNATIYPSIYYTGRLAGDPAGQMTQGEAAIIDGTGSQTAGGNRWGDYTDMTVDPVDDCTFWYVNEYVPTTSAAGWQLRVGAFKFGSCGADTPTPTVTGTPPTATRTRTSTPTFTATATPCASGAIVNGGFETGTLPPWTVLGTNPAPVVSTAQAHSGTHSALLGTISGPEPLGDGSLYQTITVPAGGGLLSYWWNGGTTDTITFDWQDAYVTNTSGTILTTIQHTCTTTTGWQNQTFDMAAYAGQTVRIEFLVHQDGFGDDTYMYVDDVALLVPCPTSTATPTVAATFTPTPTPTSTVCPIQFTDVPNPSTFYVYIRCLACRNIVNGYSDGTFRPNNNVTRGQLSKIVSNSAGYSDPQTTQLFEDVPPSGPNSTFFVFIGRLASRGYISGYACGGVGEPCNPPTNRPYFRPNNNATRGQISKIDSNAAGFVDPPSGQQFQDVPPGSTYYTYTYRLVSRSIMSGYACGGTTPPEPCIPPGNLPYFRPNNNATRGQTSKIVANTFFPDCDTPSLR